ncbi:hypothetical protein MRB53_039911 [Persea americana]|nr:hypothetical protein MRB53_039911 [Persea americana]
MAEWRSYANGPQSNGSSSYLNRFDFQDGSSRENSTEDRTRTRGAGGYGGLGAYTADSQSRGQVQAPTRIERQYGRRSRPDPAWTQHSRSRSRANTAFGAGHGQIEDTLRYIERQWAFMAEQDCVPVKIALQLKDASSLGLMDQYDQFQDTHQQLQNALKVIVNEHHQGFKQQYRYLSQDSSCYTYQSTKSSDAESRFDGSER